MRWTCSWQAVDQRAWRPQSPRPGKGSAFSSPNATPAWAAWGPPACCRCSCSSPTASTCWPATASQLGARESRRILGDYILTLEDFKSRAVFPDEIGRYSYAVDIHAAKPDLASYKQYAEDFKNLRYGKGESYGIPYRCLVPRKLTNVLVAGRCVSTDRYMQSSIRVMPGCFITGQAIGVAAAICAKQDCDTRGVPMPELHRRLKDLGAYLPNY